MRKLRFKPFRNIRRQIHGQDVGINKRVVAFGVLGAIFGVLILRDNKREV